MPCCLTLCLPAPCTCLQDVNPNGEGLLCDLLWADPSANISGWCPNPRGVSYVFGLDVAQRWMRDNGLRAIVRAHMVQQTGFEVLGNNEVMTVFSAADYRESGGWPGLALDVGPVGTGAGVKALAASQPCWMFWSTGWLPGCAGWRG